MVIQSINIQIGFFISICFGLQVTIMIEIITVIRTLYFGTILVQCFHSTKIKTKLEYIGFYSIDLHTY
jgi:hypothetical protein